MVEDEPAAPPIKKVNTKGSCSAVDLSGDDFGSTSQCELYVECNSLTRFVALGKCYEGVKMLHNVSLPSNFMKVTMEKVLNGDLAVPVPTSEQEPKTKLPLRKKKILSIDDPVAALVEVATKLDTIVLEVPWDANVFGRHSNLPLYVHMSDLLDLAARDQEINESLATIDHVCSRSYRYMSNRQRGNYECGYYVMQWMLTILQADIKKGRVCLIKSVLTAIPLFYLSFYKAPISVFKKITSIQRRLLWAAEKEQRYISWVRWDRVCKVREEGGLGIKDVRLFNRALLAKWKWRLMSEEKGLWKEVLESKYYSRDNRNKDYGHCHSWWWRDLSKACGEEEGEGWFHNQVAWKVGSGEQISFWDDVWMDNKKLKQLFPRLHTISLDQGKKVSEVGYWEDMEWSWRLRWRRPRFEWKSTMEADLMNLITRKRLTKETEHVMVWNGDPNGVFAVKSAYQYLCHSITGISHNGFSLLWQAKALPKALYTAWRVVIGRLHNLTRRGLEGSMGCDYQEYMGTEKPDCV
ncbi:uncharacterized protein [Phaseolus vulgaris]|uniref:uncharacterized protein n=1 Tax=Phaseolus vulgaris TaxID=3885 RepID=UPI0035CAAD13